MPSGWTQERIAEEMGIDRTTIVNIHNSLRLRGDLLPEPEKRSGPGRPSVRVDPLPPQRRRGPLHVC